jgi:cobalt-zinc-cadmium efflux system protein
MSQHHHHDLNQRVAVAVLVSALVVGRTGWFWLDAVTAIGVGAAVIWSAVDLLREAIALNLDATPRHINLAEVKQLLTGLPGVESVEAVHIWGLSTSRTALTAHLVVDVSCFESSAQQHPQQLIQQAQSALAGMGIRKSTLQLETSHHHCGESR